jgi:BCD family chlorophyll transporter-like MFS transporter
LEPYGGQVLGLSVASTTKLTALLATGTLIGFACASRGLGRGGSPDLYAIIGASIGIPGFLAIIFSSLGAGIPIFLIGTFATGLGAGLFGHATLTATLRAAPENGTGLALGAWGAVQATAAGVGIASAGIVRDIVVGLNYLTGSAAEAPYNFVFAIEILFLALAVSVAVPFLKAKTRQTTFPEARESFVKHPKANSNPVEVT